MSAWLRGRARIAGALVALAAAALVAVLVLTGGDDEGTNGFQGAQSAAALTSLPADVIESLGLQGLGQRSPNEPIEAVLQDDAQLLHRPETLDDSIDKIKALGIGRIRITAGWSVLTRNADETKKPDNFDAKDPAAYEQDKFSNLDRLIRAASKKGLKAMIDIAFWAPRWATTDAEAGRARTNVDPEAYRDFAVAVVKRYDGSFKPSSAGKKEDGGSGSGSSGDGSSSSSSSDDEFLDKVWGGVKDSAPEGKGDGGESGNGGQATTPEASGEPLPKVSMWTIWNEPNHPAFLQPQWKPGPGGFVPESPNVYRRLVYAAYPAIKEAMADAVVLVGGTSSTGASLNKGRGGVQPIRFLRALACVDEAFQPLSEGDCKDFKPIPGDGWSHHPYSLHSTPDARNTRQYADNAPMGEIGKLTDTLNRLAEMGRISPRDSDLYLTEYGSETNPPDPHVRWSMGDQAKFLTWAEYLAWSNPSVKMFPQFLLRDMPGSETTQNAASPTRALGNWQSGLYFADGTPKLAAETFKAGLFAIRVPGKNKVLLWARIRAPKAAQVRVVPQGQATAASPISLAASAAPGVFAQSAPASAGTRYKLTYVEDGKVKESPAVSPVTATAPSKAKRGKRIKKRRASR